MGNGSIQLGRKAQIAIVAVLGALAASGSYLAGNSSGEDVDAARDAGRAEGQQEGAARGAARGYSVGMAAGEYKGYADAYRRAYREAFEDAGVDPPETIEVPER